MGVVRRNVSAGGPRLWTYADFAGLPPAAVSQALSRLSREGVLQRVRKGVYHKPEQTVVGPSRPRESAVVFKVLGGSARPTGPTAANVLGFSTQTLPVAVYAVSAANKPSRLEGARVIPRRPELPRSLGAEDAAILEILRDRGCWAELSPEETVARMQKLLREEGRYERLARAAAKEPPRVRAMLGALGETIGAPGASVAELRKTLNPLSRFEFGLFRVLPNAKEWQAKVGCEGGNTMVIQNVWQRIENLPAEWQKLASSELASFKGIWAEQKQKLEGTEQFRRFNERLAREWAIETGILENLYELDRGVTQLLIEKGLDEALLDHGSTNKPTDYVIQLITDQRDALEGLFDFVAQRRPLSTSYLKELHHLLVRNQDYVDAIDTLGRHVRTPLVKGDWKRLPNNPSRPDGSTYVYCPPEHVASEMERLVEMHHAHVEATVPAEVSAAWLHHRFAQIHPFQDGNGRMARSTASLVFIQAGLFPLVVRRDDRAQYIEALEAADAGDLSLLVALFVRLQKDQFKQAIRISEDVLMGERSLDAVLEGLVQGLKERETEKAYALTEVLRISPRLEEFCLRELEDLRNRLQPQICRVNQEYWCGCDRSSEETSFYYRNQIIETARRLGYYADLNTYRAWVRLRVQLGRFAQTVFSFHGAGYDFAGMMACNAFLEFMDEDDEGTTTRSLTPICESSFFFYYDQTPEEAEERFRAWLHEVVMTAVVELKRNL